MRRDGFLITFDDGRGMSSITDVGLRDSVWVENGAP